jgi:hypothetical protein
MAINHVLVVTDGTQGNTTLDIIEVLAALPILDSTNLIVTDNVASAITILAEIKSSIERDSSTKLASERWKH